MTKSADAPSRAHAPDDADAASERVASPYSTGGGGVTLERRIAAMYLAKLLTGEGAEELGDGRAITSIAFQQAPRVPIDDLLLLAAMPEAEPSLELAIGVRRAPRFVPSDANTQKLVVEYVRALELAPKDGPEHRLALAVAGPQPHATEIAELAGLARNQMDALGFFALTETRGRIRRALVRRLGYLKDMVAEALRVLGAAGQTDGLAQQRTWQLLSRLSVLMPRVEEPDVSDWVNTRNSLMAVARGGGLVAAGSLLDRLETLAAQYASAAAVVDLAILSRDTRALLAEKGRRHRRGPSAGRENLGDWIADLPGPMALGVHESASPDDGRSPVLPAYVPRAHDERLRTIMETAGQASLMVVLVGDSSTGKTRALWEAVHYLRDDWRVWAPASARVLNEGLAAGGVGPRTVVWLNDAHNFLDPESSQLAADTAARLRGLIANQDCGPVMVAATLWPEKWQRLTAEPRWSPSAAGQDSLDEGPAHVPALLSTAVYIQVPGAFEADDLIAVSEAAIRDPALALALANAPSGKITQYLAGAPKLLERYASAPPAARALVDAAVDARRFGHGNQLPQRLLLEAAPGYIDADIWDLLPDDWGIQALNSMTEDWRGLPGPLTLIRSRTGEAPAAEPEYRLADVLEQKGGLDRRYAAPPADFWDAITRRAHPDDLASLGHAAQQRCRYRDAAQIYAAAAAADDPWALEQLALMQYRVGNHAAAERIGVKAAQAGIYAPLEILASYRMEARDRKGAERLYQLAAQAGDIEVRPFLPEFREEAGDPAEAERLALEAGNDGDTQGLYRLVRMRAKARNYEDAERLAIRAADIGDPEPLAVVAGYWQSDGNRNEAERLYRLAARFGATNALTDLSVMLAKAGNVAQAEQVAQEAAANGNTQPLVELAHYLRSVNAAASNRLYRQAADLRNGIALELYAKGYARAGRLEQAIRLAIRAAKAGETQFAVELARERMEAGNYQQAELLARNAADFGDADALNVLALMRENEGNYAEAERLVIQAALADAEWTLDEIVEQRENRGDRVGAERLALDAVKVERRTQSGDWVITSRPVHAIMRLISSREYRADYDGAEQLAIKAADCGYVDGLKDLAESRRRRRHYMDAERLYEMAADAGDISAPAGIAAMLEENGNTAGAKVFYQRAINGGYEGALHGLAKLLERTGDQQSASYLTVYGLDADGNPALPWTPDYSG